jgi:hypothetical protein
MVTGPYLYHEDISAGLKISLTNILHTVAISLRSNRLNLPVDRQVGQQKY